METAAGAVPWKAPNSIVVAAQLAPAGGSWQANKSKHRFRIVSSDTCNQPLFRLAAPVAKGQRHSITTLEHLDIIDLSSIGLI